MSDTISNPTLGVYCMSYRRPDAIRTLHVLEQCTYVVREEEADAYRAAGVIDLLVIPTGAVRSFMSTLYWIIDNAPEDVLFIADDDIDGFVYRMKDTRDIETPEGLPDTETIQSEIERIAQMMVDLGLGYAFDQSTLAPYAYNAEFRFIGMPGHIRWINKLALKAKYNPKDPAASDVDMMMQELMFNRIVLQPKYLCVKADMDKNDGDARTRQAHIAFVEAMKNKWGRYYDYDFTRNIARISVDR